MFIIECPWCGPRDQSEFTAHGEAHLTRPQNPAELTDAQWGDYLFFRHNPKGVAYERWTHIHGCRRWFNLARNTADDRIYGSYKPGENAPQIPPEPAAEARR